MPNAPQSPPKKVLAPNLLLLQGLISLVTGPMLLTLVGGKIMTTLIQDLGQLSEELFRGDRLPVLNVPPTGPTPPESNDP